MKKKYILTLMAVLNITAFAATPVLAYEYTGEYTTYDYIIDYSTYKHGIHDMKWERDESEAELVAWANARKDTITALPTEADKYDAVVKAVCDFMTYDTNYAMASHLYTQRDGKGVCADYTVLTKALCDAVGIKCEVAKGILYNDGHTWNIVTINGVEYYSDTTGVDAGMDQYRLSQSLWKDYTFQNKYITLSEAVKLTGCFMGENTENSIHAPVGGVIFKDSQGIPYTVTESDYNELISGKITISDIMNKYGVK